MKENKYIIIALIIAISGVISTAIVVSGLKSYKQANNGGLSATGSATTDFVSDLAIWGGSFDSEAETTKEAYEDLKKKADIVKNYLIKNNLSENEFVFSAVSISQKFKDVRSEYGNYLETIPDGFSLSQRVTVTSDKVDIIESISRDISSLIDFGVDFFPESVQFYYTKLDELKLEMIETATINAKARIDLLAKNSNSKVGKLSTANLGIFQITGRNSTDDDFSYMGAFNTNSKEKTASVTVKLYYSVE